MEALFFSKKIWGLEKKLYICGVKRTLINPLTFCAMRKSSTLQAAEAKQIALNVSFPETAETLSGNFTNEFRLIRSLLVEMHVASVLAVHYLFEGDSDAKELYLRQYNVWNRDVREMFRKIQAEGAHWPIEWVK